MTQSLRPTANQQRLEDVSEVFRALASPVRIAMIDQLAAGELCVHEIVSALSISQPLASQHLRVLRSANLVTRVRRGREVAYTVADEHVASIVRDALLHAGEPASDPDAAATTGLADANVEAVTDHPGDEGVHDQH